MVPTGNALKALLVRESGPEHKEIRIKVRDINKTEGWGYWREKLLGDSTDCTRCPPKNVAQF